MYGIPLLLLSGCQFQTTLQLYVGIGIESKLFSFGMNEILSGMYEAVKSVQDDVEVGGRGRALHRRVYEEVSSACLCQLSLINPIHLCGYYRV